MRRGARARKVSKHIGVVSKADQQQVRARNMQFMCSSRDVPLPSHGMCDGVLAAAHGGVRQLNQHLWCTELLYELR